MMHAYEIGLMMAKSHRRIIQLRLLLDNSGYKKKYSELSSDQKLHIYREMEALEDQLLFMKFIINS